MVAITLVVLSPSASTRAGSGCHLGEPLCSPSRLTVKHGSQSGLRNIVRSRGLLGVLQNFVTSRLTVCR